jgi:hypothetical protein
MNDNAIGTDADKVETFLVRKIQEDPSMAPFNETLLSLYKAGMISASYDKEVDDYDFSLTFLGQTSYYESIAQAFTPGEA